MQTAPWKAQGIPDKERTARAKRKLAGGDEMKSHITSPVTGPPLVGNLESKMPVTHYSDWKGMDILSLLKGIIFE